MWARLVSAGLVLFFHAAGASAAGLEPFTASGDVGTVGAAGRVESPAGTGTFRITSSGANIWGAEDSFYFVRKEVTGDLMLTASVDWATPGGNAHKKAGLMLRAGTDADAPHAGVFVHSDGLISLQFRRQKGGPTEEARAALKSSPARIMITRLGDVIHMEVAAKGGELQPAAALTVALPQAILAGLAASSHDNADTQTAVFSEVALQELGSVDEKTRAVESTLETVEIATGIRRIVRRAVEHFEAPNWTNDGKFLYYNGGGKIWRIPAGGGTPVHIPTGEVQVNNDHGLSPDGKTLVISGRTGRGQSQIFTLSAEGGTPKLITPQMPSYWHGWSPDGKTLAYCASRNNEYDIYTIPVDGGEELRLTTATGLDDGPEYSPDGRWIYFNSERSGLMRIWRMKADGSGQEMVSTGPDAADWFAHPSPDGQWIIYISYDKSVKGHPANKDVTLKLAPASGGPARVLVTLFGGQGTMNVPSWSPDSKHVAFVSYRLLPPKR